jgi:putative transposase
VFLDAIMVKVRGNQVVQNKPAYLAIGMDADGEKHVLGIWLAKTPPETATAGEGARFWGSVMTDLRNRGGAGHPDRLLRRAGRVRGRHRLRVPRHHGAALRRPPRQERPAAVARRDAGEVAKELRAIYTALTAEAAFDALAAFAASPWGRPYPQMPRCWYARTATRTGAEARSTSPGRYGQETQPGW